MGQKIKGNIFLIGFMGAGKSTVAAALQKELDMELVEMDAELVKREGMPISDIFASKGEAYFRDAESSFVRELEASEGKIVSCGGGVVVRPENVESMKKNGRIILLTAEPETIYERVRYSQDRPILNGNMNVAYIRELMNKRKDLYIAAADHIIETDHKGVTTICQEIIKEIG